MKVVPCPFCEGTSIFLMTTLRVPASRVQKHYLICISCGARGPLADNEASAVKKWNAVK